MSSDITLRLEKGTDLSYAEGDENFTHIRRLYRFTEDSVTSGGAGNSYTITSTAEPVTAFSANMIFGFIANHTNTSTTPVMNIDGLAAKQIKDVDGSDLNNGALTSGAFYLIRYNEGTDNYWLINNTQLNVLAQEVVQNAADIAAIDSELIDINSEQAAIRGTQGVAAGSTNMGTFTGDIIPDNSTVKVALQSLETETDALGEALADGALSAVASGTGSITLPYSASNAIVINWGSIVVSANATTFDSFATPVDAIYQAVVCYGSMPSSEPSAASINSLTTTNLTIRNSSNASSTMRWIAIGRKAI